MNTNVKQFEDIIINYGGTIIVGYFKMLCVFILIAIAFDLYRRNSYKKPLFLTRNFLWVFVTAGKAAFSSVAFAIIFFADFETGTFNIHNISQIPKFSISTFLVGALAAIEMVSVVESILNKFINRE